MSDRARTIGLNDTDGQRKPVVIVAGPTASGKSRLALALACAFDGVIINADAMQVYRELEILTARPGPDELAIAPHCLYGVLQGREVCSAGVWRDLAEREIAAAHEVGRLPLVVGGTGLYLRALLVGLSELPDVPESARDAARERLKVHGPAALHAALAQRDPIMAERLRPSDSQRLVRAWEVLEATGRSLAAWQAQRTPVAGHYRFLRLALVPPRDALYEACDERFLKMMEAGALDEVRALMALGLPGDRPVMKALGVPQLSGYLADRWPLEQAIEKAQQATRNYAKRQMTWLRGPFAQDRPDSEAPPMTFNAQYSESLKDQIFTNIRKKLLNLKD